MDFKEMQYICAIARNGSVSRAAQELYVPQPTLSNALKRVEEEYGQKLFERTGSGLQITLAGKRFADLAQQMLDIRRQLGHDMHEFSENHIGEIKIGICSNHYSDIILPAMVQFCKMYNGSVRFVQSSTSKLELMLSEGEIDVALMLMPIDTAQYEYISICREQMLLAVSQKNPICQYAIEMKNEPFPIMKPEYLNGQSIIMPAAGGAFRKRVEQYLDSYNIRYNVAVSISDIPIAIALAANDVGISFAPDWFAVTHKIGNPPPMLFSFGGAITNSELVAAKRRDNNSDAVDIFLSCLQKTASDWRLKRSQTANM